MSYLAFEVLRCTMLSVVASAVYVYASLRVQDERVRLCSETLTGIRIVKMHAWELPLGDRIRVARSLELSKLGALLEHDCMHVLSPCSLDST